MNQFITGGPHPVAITIISWGNEWRWDDGEKKLLEFENHHLMSIHFLPQHQFPRNSQVFVRNQRHLSREDLEDGKGTKDFLVRWSSSGAEAGHPYVFFVGTIWVYSSLLCIFGTIMYYINIYIYTYIHDQFRFQKLDVFLWKLSNFGIVVLFPDLVSWIGKSTNILIQSSSD